MFEPAHEMFAFILYGAVKALARLRKRAVSLEPSLLVHTMHGLRWRRVP